MQPPMHTTQQRFSFSGTGSAYFRIWIVNLVLTLLSLGIYSAWAKVRRMQYFYRHTSLNESSFDYHGTPTAILKGRVIGVGLFAAYYTTTLKFMPLLGLAVGLVIALFMPLLLLASFRFRLYNSSYRGLRFNFTGSIKSAYITFLLLPLGTLFTLYLLAPFTHQRIKSYQHGNSRFGQSPFTFDADVGGFYKIYFFALMQFFLIIGLVVLVAYSVLQGSMASMATLSKEAIVGFVVIAYLLLITATLLIVPYFISRIQNLAWNHTALGGNRFSSTLSARGVAWIMFSNLILIVVSLGLFKPFADVRMARYRIEHMALLPVGNMEDFIASAQQQIGATGTETAEVFDVDIGF